MGLATETLELQLGVMLIQKLLHIQDEGSTSFALVGTCILEACTPPC